ncbi:DUF5919 domain-containing protein, partial [Streptomyces niveus]
DRADRGPASAGLLEGVRPDLSAHQGRARLRDPGAFEIQVFDETPRFTAYLVDGDGPDGLAVVQSYLRRARGMEAPVLVLRGAGRDVVRVGQDQEHGLFQTYREEFESVWADSRPVS